GAGTIDIQVGAHDGQTISINLKEISSETLKLDNFTVERKAPNTGNALDLTTATLDAGDDAGLSVTDALATLSTALGTTVTADDISVHEVLDADEVGTGQYVIKHGTNTY